RYQIGTSRALDRKALYVAENRRYNTGLKHQAVKIAVFIAASPN
ncbi:MAG: hypothetical protein ACI80I_001317, partial [Akkermansiaceae bacterium]